MRQPLVGLLVQDFVIKFVVNGALVAILQLFLVIRSLVSGKLLMQFTVNLRWTTHGLLILQGELRRLFLRCKGRGQPGQVPELILFIIAPVILILFSKMIRQ